MLDTSTQTLIADEVRERVDNDEMFTAFDISLAVQQTAKDRGEAVARHRDMKQTIHDEMDAYMQHGVYNRTLRDVGAPSHAYIYHPVNEDPNDYVPMQRKDRNQTQSQASVSVPPQPSPTVATVTTTTTTATASRNAAPKSPSDCASLGRHTDNRGTLTIPAILMLAANFRPHDKAVFYNDTDNNGDVVGVIAHQTPPNKDALTEYTVDRDANVRVTAHQLNQAGIGGDGLAYDFEGGNDFVLIRQHS